jgi:putative transposase
MFREFVKGGLALLRDLVRGHAKLVAENTLLRQQVVVLQRGSPRPHLKPHDRFTIATITKLFHALLGAVAIVRPETVLRWHRSFWRLIWRRRSRRPAGALPSMPTREP